MATHSSTLAWKVPWMEEPGRLQYMGSQSQTRLSDFTFTFHFHALKKEMTTHSSVLAWRIPGTGEPGGLLSMGSHRVGHDWSDLAAWMDNSSSNSKSNKILKMFCFSISYYTPWKVCARISFIWHNKIFSPKEAAAAAAKSLLSCPTLCDTIDGSPPGSPIPGIL